MQDMAKPGSEKYKFAVMGEEIIAALIAAAKDQVTEANNLLDSTNTLAEGIRSQIKEQCDLLDQMSDRLNVFGESIIEAHTKFLNGKK